MYPLPVKLPVDLADVALEVLSLQLEGIVGGIVDDEPDLPQSVESSDEETLQLFVVSLVAWRVEHLARAVHSANKQTVSYSNSVTLEKVELNLSNQQFSSIRIFSVSQYNLCNACLGWSDKDKVSVSFV